MKNPNRLEVAFPTTHQLAYHEDASWQREHLINALLSARRDLVDRLAKYEATGDHDHGRGPIAPGARCPGGDCVVARVRSVLESLTDALSDVARKEDVR